MNKKDRAKIFMPFDALKGFRESLREAERVVSVRRELSIDDEVLINEKINKLNVNNFIKVTYYDITQEEYITKEGILTRIDETLKTISIVKDVISMSDIVEIELLDIDIL